MSAPTLAALTFARNRVLHSFPLTRDEATSLRDQLDALLREPEPPADPAAQPAPAPQPAPSSSQAQVPA